MSAILVIFGARILMVVRQSPAVDDTAKSAVKRIVIMGISAVAGLIVFMVCVGIANVPSSTIPMVKSFCFLVWVFGFWGPK